MERVLRQRDIVLLPFPFSDGERAKVRPALVLSNDEYNRVSEDALVCAITSRARSGPYTVALRPHQLEEGKLHKKSVIRADTTTRIRQDLVHKRVGRVPSATHALVAERLRSLIG